MTPWTQILLTLVASLAIAPASLFIYHSQQKRKEGAAEAEARAHREKTEAQWRVIDRHTREIALSDKKIAVLESKIDDLPNETAIRGFLDALEDKLEARFTNLGNQIQRLFEQGH